MEYFMTHILYIVIAALIIAGLAAIWAFGAAHNANNRDPEMQAKQDTACESCALASMCTRFGAENKDGLSGISESSCMKGKGSQKEFIRIE